MQTKAVRTILLLALALVAALVIWILALRADGVAPIEPALRSGIESRATPDLHGASDVVAPSPKTDRTVPVVESATNVNASSSPTLIVVRVTAVETDEPVEHVRINAWGEKTLLVLGSQAQETDEEGFVEMEVEPGHPLIVNAQGDGIMTGSAQVRIEALKPGERRSVALSVLTRPDRVVHGIVLRRDTREAIPDVLVEAMSLPASDSVPRVVTGNDGRFTIALRSFATAALRYDHPEFGTALSPVRTNHDRPENALEILLDRAASLRALVSAARGADTSSWTLVATAQASDLVQPRDAWDIRAAPFSWSTSLATRLEGLPAQVRLSVEIRDGTRAVWRASPEIVLTPGEERVITTIVGTGTLEGFVRDADGNTLRNIEIAIVPASLEGDRRILAPQTFDVKVTCSDDGSYRFEHVPLGSWFVLPAIDAQATLHQHRGSLRLAERFEIQRDGDRVVHDIVLVPGYFIAGRVVDGNGNGVAAAAVTARHESILGEITALSEQDGSFVLSPLPAGTCTLIASATGLSPVEGVRVTAGTLDVVLTLGAQTRVVAEVRDELDVPIHGASVSIHAADGKGSLYGYTTDATGTAIHVDPVRGSVHVAASTSDGRFAAVRDLVVVPGRDTHVVLRVERGGRTRLRFDGPGTSALVLVLDRGLCLYAGTIVSGREVDISGPVGEFDMQLTVDGKRHDRRVRLEREPSGTVAFENGWK